MLWLSRWVTLLQDGNESLPIVQGGSTVKDSAEDIRKFINSGTSFSTMSQRKTASQNLTTVNTDVPNASTQFFADKSTNAITPTYATVGSDLYDREKRGYSCAIH